MSDYLHLPIAAGVSLLASLSVLAVLTPSLHQLLRRLCPDEAAAAFWLSYTRVMLVIAPLLLVLPAQAQVAPTASEIAAYQGLHAAAARGDVPALCRGRAA